MKTPVKFIIVYILLFAVALGCSSNDDGKIVDDDVSQTDDDNINDDDDTNDDDDSGHSADYEIVDVQINLPTGSTVDLANAELYGMGTAADVDTNGSGELPFNPGTTEIAYLFDSNGDLILAGFLTDNRKEISTSTTAEVLFYFGMLSSVRATGYKSTFVENIVNEQAFLNFAIEFDALFSQNPKTLSEGGFAQDLNQALVALEGKKLNDIGYSTMDIAPSDSESGLTMNKIGGDSFTIDNSFPRRAHAFLYQVSYEDEAGNETILLSEISNGVMPDRESEIPYISLLDESNGNQGNQTFNAALCSSDALNRSETSEQVNLALAEGNLKETWEVAVVGPGSALINHSGREMTVNEQAKFEELSVQTFVMDYFIPVLMDIGGNKDVYDDLTLQQADEIVVIVESMLRAHEPSFSAVLAGSFTTALEEFLPFLYDDIRLSDDLRTILWALYSYIDDSGSPNTFIQNNELIEDGIERYNKIIASIHQSFKDSEGLQCIRKLNALTSKFEKWEVVVEEGIVDISPEYMTTTNEADGKEIWAEVITGGSGPYEYEWSTTSNYGGFISDVQGNNGTSFTTDSDTILFISTASNEQLSDSGENLETVTVKVFEGTGSDRTEIGSNSMTVNVRKGAPLYIKPNNATIEGDENLTLYIVNALNQRIVPDDERDYKVVWQTQGKHGRFEGISKSLTTYNESSIVYTCTDTETAEGEEEVYARVYSRPKNGSEGYKLYDELEATIKIRNDERIEYETLNLEHFTTCNGQTERGTDEMVVYVPKREDATQYYVVYEEIYFGWADEYGHRSPISWTNDNYNDYYITDLGDQFRVRSVWAGGPCDNTVTTAKYATIQGYATLATTISQ